MPYSMTGIGRASGEIKKPPIKFEVEIKSYNHRFLDISLKVPASFTPYEEEIRKIIQAKVSRGHVVVIVQQDKEILSNRFEVDRPLLQAYLTLAKELKKRYKAKGNIDINTLLSIPGLIRLNQNRVDTRTIFDKFKPVFNRAFGQFLKMKQKEGENTAREINRSLNIIEEEIRSVERLIPVRNECYRNHLSQLLKDIADKIDQERLYQELLYVAERTDVTEECKRLSGHLGLFRESLDNEPHPGRRLNFLLQEMQREANTLSVKANYFTISKAVVNIKEEIEKIREQVQNIE